MVMKKFTIDRNLWARKQQYSNEAEYETRLHTIMGTKCCLGFWLSQIHGVPDKVLLNKHTPISVGIEELTKLSMCSPPYWELCLQSRLIATNDRSTLVGEIDWSNVTDEMQEQLIAKGFELAGYEVEFVN